MSEVPGPAMLSSNQAADREQAGSVAPRPTIGILYPGELGSALGRLLAQSGLTVMTVVEGRSQRTRRFAEEAGLSLLRGQGEMAERADIVLSTVSPAAALSVARDYLASRPKPTRSQVYVDLNSTSPETAHQLDSNLHSAGLDFVDGAIHGLASRLPDGGTLYLSGATAQQLANVLGRVLRIKVLGQQAGQASLFKMLISGLAKGVAALFVEMSLAGRRAGLLEELLVCYRQSNPGLVELVERLLPTYPQHAVRRAEEACAVEQTIQHLGLRPCVSAGAREWAEELVRAGLGRAIHEKPAQPDSLLELIESFAARGILERAAVEKRQNSCWASQGQASGVASAPRETHSGR